MESSNMSSIESHLCGICQEQYNDSNRAPRVVCPEIHNICSECLEGLLKKSKKKFICPFDRSESEKKPLSQYPVNRGLLQIAQDLVKTSSRKHCSRCPAEATRLCLECNDIQCNNCILDYHEDHKKLKLTDVSKMLTEKKNKLFEEVLKLEASTSGQEGVKRYVDIKENELTEKAYAIFEDYQRILEDKKEVILSEIKKKLGEINSEFLAKKPQKNNNKNDELYKWINETKSLTQNGNNNMMDHRILCGLYKQEDRLKKLDMSKLQLDEPKEELMFNKVLNKITLECNELFLENFKRTNLVKFELPKNNFDFDVEESKSDLSTSERSANKSISAKSNNNSFKDSESETSDRNYVSSDYQFEPFILSSSRVNSSPIHSRDQSLQQDSEWIENGQKSEQNPIKDDIQLLRNTFEAANLGVQVKYIKESNSITLDSLYDKVKSSSCGLKGDEGLEKFYSTIANKELAPSLKKVTSLNLTCIAITKNGAMNLSKSVDKLPSLEVVRVGFQKSENLFHGDLNPFMQTLGRCKNLSTLELTCQRWKNLLNKNLSYTIGNLALLPKLKNLTLDFSECHNLTSAGIMKAFESLSSLVSLEDFKIAFNGCSNLRHDEACLKSIYQVYSKMVKLQRIEFDFLGCPGFTERNAEDLIGPSKVNAKLVPIVNVC